MHGASTGTCYRFADTSSEFDVLNPKLQGGGIWVQIGVGVLGAAGFVDLPVRAGLVALGMTRTWAGITRGLWLVIVGILLAFAFPNSHPLIQRVFALTYPWLADQRLLQVASIFASLLAAGGLVLVIDWLARQRRQHASTRPVATRWLSIAVALVVLFVAEGSGVSIYKSLAQAGESEGSFSSDDRVVMAWLRQHVGAGETVANDAAVDAGIWAPYKADVHVLLPRSGLEPDPAIRQIVRDNIADLNAAPVAQTEACLLRLSYVYYGSRVFEDEVHHFPPPPVLAVSQGLEEAFRSGNAVVFKTRLRCD